MPLHERFARIFADSGSKLSYYHDRLGLEADAVLHLDDGRYALIECKLESGEIDDGAKHLLELRRLVREANMATRSISCVSRTC